LRVCSKHILFDLSSRLAANDTIDSVLPHREVDWAKDLSSPRYTGKSVVGDKFSVAWYHPIGLMHEVAREGECSSSAAWKRDVPSGKEF